VLGYVAGSIELSDELLTKFFDSSSQGLRREVLGHLGWTLTGWKETAPDVLERVRLLWDSRMTHVRASPDGGDELLDFYWYVKADQLPPGWWLPRLIEVCRLSENFVSRGMISEEIAAAAREYPEETLAVLELMLLPERPHQPFDNHDLVERTAPEVIARCLDTNDQELDGRALGLMNYLGSIGFQDMEDRVRTRRNGGEPA